MLEQVYTFKVSWLGVKYAEPLRKPRLFYEGTTAGNIISNVCYPSLDNVMEPMLCTKALAHFLEPLTHKPLPFV